MSVEPSEEPSSSPSLFPYPLNICLNDNSTVVEDILMPIGADITWENIPGRTEEVAQVDISGFPVGSEPQYTLPNQSPQVEAAVGAGFTLTIAGTDVPEVVVSTTVPLALTVKLPE